MNRFTADFSSSINSTPGKESQQPQRKPLFSSQLPSTTPIAPPPSQIFGSSAFGTGVSKLQFSKTNKSSPPNPNSSTTQPIKNGTPGRPGNRPFHTSFGSSQISEYRDEDEEEAEYERDVDMEEDEMYEDRPHSMSPEFQSTNRPSMPSLMKFSTRSTNSPEQSRKALSLRRSLRSIKITTLPYKGDEAIVVNLARDLASRSRPAPVTESDDIILQTEQLLRSLDAQLQHFKDNRETQEVVTDYAQALIREWRSSAEIARPTFDGEAIGPPTTSSLFTKANYLASLLLTLRHPPASLDGGSEPTPKILLDWLDQYHISYDSLARDVATYNPNSTASGVFWGVVQSLVLRGKIQQVIQLFADADFKYAATAIDDGSEQPGYKGAQLQSTQSVIYRAREILNLCPAYQTGDWNVAGVEWDLYRSQVEAELDYLNELNNTLDEEDDDSFEAENFGIRKPTTTLLTKLGRKSTSTIPWSIYTGLKIIYNILLGSAEEIVQQSQDWLEAVTSLTIWWDGTAEAAVAQWSFDVSKANNLMDEIDSDINPYLQRLRAAFLSVTSPEAKTSELRMNTLSPIEVGLGNILQGNIEGALSILQTLSQTVTEAVAEVGTKGGWLKGDASARPGGFNEDDLMVLNYGNPTHGITKDEIIQVYAEAIFEKSELSLADGADVEGWEIAISLVTRMDDQEVMHATVSGFLDQLDVVTQDRAEKVTNLCSDLGLPEEARKVSDRFGDHLVNNTAEYGTALLAYARSHSPNKIRQLVDLLISYSIVQSRAYPPDNELDPGLSHLVSNPKTALSDIADIDPEAAELLQFYLVGYACLRRFYNLRDEGTATSSQNKSTKQSGLRPLARRRAAAKALIAAIESAADSIYGGLYDPERQSAIQVDGLLPLLGEATALLATSTNPSTFTTSQIYSLLAAIEDLSTVSSRVYDATEECLQASLRNFHGSQPPSPHAMLKKSISSGTNSNFSFSLMGSEMLAASGITSGGSKSGTSSGVLVRKPGTRTSGASASSTGSDGRGWDWRARFADPNVSGTQIVKALRIGLAEELSLAELGT